MAQFDEPQFQKWYRDWASKLKLNPNPDDPEHYYDYRSAFKENAKPDETGHWPSKFKLEGHPNLYINGVDTRTGMPQSINQPSSFVPDSDDKPSSFIADKQEEKPSLLKRGWNAISEPLLKFSPNTYEQIHSMDQPSTTRTPQMAWWEGLRSGLLEGAAKTGESFTSPLNIALTLSGLGEARAAKNISSLGRLGKTAEAYEAVPNLLRFQKARQIASAPVLAHGVGNAFSPESTPGERAFGVAETAGGLAGMFGGPFVKMPAESNIGGKPTSYWHPELPPAPLETPRFIGGEFGTAEAGRQYPFDLGQIPDVFSGTVLPQEFGEVTRVNPEVAAQYGGAQGHPLAFRDPNMYTGQEIPGVPQSPIQPQQPFIPDSDIPMESWYPELKNEPSLPQKEQLNQELLRAQQQSHAELLNQLGPEFVPPEMTDAFNAIRSGQIMPSPEDVALNAVTRNQFGFEHPSEYTPDEITQLQEQFGTTPRPPVINRGEQPIPQPTARFLGYGAGEGGEAQPMYNIEGGESHGSTVSAQKLADMGIEVPETPDFTPEMRVSGDELRRRALSQMKPEEPSAARIKGGIKIGADVKSLGKVLGSSLYKGDITKIATKELLQNSMDAVRHLGENGQIDVTLGRIKENPYVEVKDNGQGLTHRELQTVFTDLGSSGKREDVNAIGGFGLAKAAPLLGGKSVEVNTVARERDGKLYQYSFKGTPDELLEGVQIDQHMVPDNTPTGTTIRTYVPEESSWYDAREFVEGISGNSPGMAGKINFREKYLEKHEPEPKTFTPSTDFTDANVTTLSSPSADVEIIIPKNAKYGPSAGVRYSVLNNGMYQTKGRHGYEEIPGVPEKVLVNIKSKVPEGHPDYPFTANREELRGTAQDLVEKYLEENIVKPSTGKRVQELRDIYHGMPEMDLPDATGPKKFFVYDVGKKFSPEELARIQRNPQVIDLATHISDVIHEALSLTGNEETNSKLEKIGLIFDEELKGIHIPSPGEGKSAVLINPFQIMSHNQPEQASAGLLHVILHELTHLEHGGHGESFTIRLSQIYEQFGARAAVAAQDRFQQSITDETGQRYNESIQEVLQRYNEARGREPTIEDPLRGTGIGAKDKRPDRKKQVPRNAQPNSTGAIERLKQVLASATPLREQQQQGYTAELGKRLAVMQGIKTPGMKGFKQQLGALKGELPKLAPEAGLEQGDVDTLIDSVTSSDRIGPWQKLNAKIGLVKLLSGKELPNRSEIQLLSRVFGPDMAGIIEMHAGVPLKLTREIVNLPKSYMAAIDLSAPFRQGIGLIHKREWRNNILPMIRMFGDAEFHQATMEAIGERPKYSLGQDAGLKLPGVDEITSREEAYASSMAETGSFLPQGQPQKLYQQTIGAGITASNRAYTGFLNKLRSDVFDNLVDLAEKAGHKTTEVDGSPTQITRDVARFVNNATGRGDLGHFEKYADDLNTVFFSPRLIASRLQTLNPKYYAKLDPFVRKEAIKSLFAIAGAGLATSMLAKEIYDKMGKKTSIGINPLSADLGKTRLGRTRLDPYGGFQQYVVGAARFIAGQTDSQAKGLMAPTRWSIAEDFGANKLNPVVKLAYELMRSKVNTQSERVDRFDKQMNVPWETEKLFIPMFVRDMYEVAQDDPDLIPLMAPAGTFGMGVQTYDEPKQQSSLRLRMR